MKRLAIHVETNQTITIDGNEKTIKPRIMIDESELLEFVKNRSMKYYGDEDDWEDVNSVNILSVEIQVETPNEINEISDILGITDDADDDDEAEYRSSTDDRMPSRV